MKLTLWKLGAATAAIFVGAMVQAITNLIVGLIATMIVLLAGIVLDVSAKNEEEEENLFIWMVGRQDMDGRKARMKVPAERVEEEGE